MAQMVQRGQVTPADELRSLLETSEKRVASVRRDCNGAVVLLRDLDRIAELWPQLEAQGMDLRPEAGRWETLQASVLRNANAILAALQQCGGIETLRNEAHPEGATASWWQLDRYVKQRRRESTRRAAIIVASVVVVGLLAWFAFQKLFPVDPKVAEAVRRMNKGEQLVLESQDWSGAAAEFRAAAALTPDDYDVWLRLGVAEELLGNTQAAGDAYARARQLLPSELEYLKGRGRAFLISGLLDKAEEDIQAVLAIRNDDPQAWYQAASVYEARGQIREAVDALEKTSMYAEQTRQNELTALSRYRMGMLMQQLGAQQAMGTPTPAP